MGSRPTHDVLVIGGGVIGLGVARELARREINVLVVEKEHDVGRGASGRNSGVVHSGFAVTPGTLKARLNVEGSRQMRALCRELSVAFAQVGTLVVAQRSEDAPVLRQMMQAGRANGLSDLEIIDADRLRELEPSVTGHAALHSPEGAIVDPFALVISLADNCVANGVQIHLDTEVTALTHRTEEWEIATTDGAARARIVVNAAGVAAPHVSAMAGGEPFASFPCRGEYLVLDRLAPGMPRHMVYPVPPTHGGLGVHFTPTTSGNTLIGPSAEHIVGPEDYATTRDVGATLLEEAWALGPRFDPSSVIARFAGLRAKISKGAYGESDFVIEESARTPGLINCVGIESPGLSSMPALAVHVAGLVAMHFSDRPVRPDFVPTQPPRPRFADMDDDTRTGWATDNADARTIVCRCEEVTRAEVLAALASPLGVRSLVAVKTRCRAGMGRCQGSFCTSRIVKIMREEFGVPTTDISLKGLGSELFAGEAKELLR